MSDRPSTPIEADAPRPSAPGPLPPRVPTPFRLRVKELLEGPGQVAVWAALGVCGLWAAGSSAPQPQLVGVVRATEVVHAFGLSGQLETLLVQEGDLVRTGDVVARLSGSELDARMAVAEEELAAVLAEVASLAASQALRVAERELANLGDDTEYVQDEQANRSRVRDEVWRLEIQARERRLAILALEVEIERDRLRADQVRVQADRLTPLIDQGFGRGAEKQDLELEERTLLGQVEANRRLLAAQVEEQGAAQASLELARGALAALPPATSDEAARLAVLGAARAADDAALDALRQRAEVRRAELGALRSERAGLVLVASVPGRVGLIQSRPGQALLAGAAVLTVEAEAARNVTVYLPEPVAGGAEVPEVVLLARRSAPERVAEAEVIGFGRGVEALPERLWRRPQVPEYGRTLIVRPPEALGLVPGEVLGVMLERP